MKDEKKRKAQAALVRAAAESPELAEEHGISQKVAQAFVAAEDRQAKRKLPTKSV